MNVSLLRVAGAVAALLGLAAQADESLFRDAHVAFKYGGKWFSCDKPVSDTALPGGTGWTSRRCEYRTPDGLLGVRVTWKFYTDYPAAEYLPELYAVGSNATKIVEKYASFDFRRTYAGTNPREDTATRIRALVGDRCCNFPFVPETHWLGDETTVGFSAVSRSSDGSFYFSALDRSKNWVEPLHDMFWPGDPLKAGYMPYLSFDFPEGDGLDLAIGWSGSWRCDCSKWKGLTTLKAGLVDTHFRVLPGETLRTPSIVLLRRAPGVSPRAFRTVKHRFIRAFKSPRDASGNLFKPLMPLTSDGGMKTDQMMVDIIKWAKDNNLGRDGFWIDAGWNGYATDVDPMKWTYWRKYHGSWTPNRVSHPDGDFKRVSAAAHDAGMKFILWCEPERVLPDSDLGKSLPPEALLSWTGSTDGFKVLNLGDPRGLDAAVDTLSRLISGSNVDVYRQDCNMRLFVKYWEEHDAPDRRGVTEMKYIAGLYEFWDRLRTKYPNLLIDNCASGGRRLDVELNSRSHCYCRSDFFINYRGEDQILSAQNTTLNTLDIQPFQGSESTPGKFGDEYGFFSATGPGLVLTPGLRGYYTKEGITPEHLAWLQKMLPACDRMRTFFQGDFYPQTEPTGLDRDVWCAYQMHRADLDAGFVMAFRRQEAPNDTLAVDLGGLDPNATYALENWDGTDLGTVRGGVLKTRPVKVAKKRDFALVFYRKVAALSPLPAAPAAGIEKDWMRQDSGRVDVSACFADARTNTLEAAMAEAVVAELERLGAPSAAVRRASLAALLKEGRPGADPAWRALYLAAARERRVLRLKKLVAKTRRIFFTRHCLIAAPGNISSNQHPSDRRGPSSGTGKSFSGKPLYLTWEPGAELCLLTLGDDGNATVETVLETPDGFIRDPALSYDGRTLAFARRENFYTDDFQICLMDVETRRTTRITVPLSPDYPISNIYPCFLPNGRIMYQSTRCAQLDPCGWDQTGTFFSMKPDGSDVRRLTADQVSTMLPTVMDDGRVLYTRWEYNDRTPVYVQPLFTMNEDGTSQAEFYGNDSWFPTSLMHARGIPGTGKAMAIASGHHTLQKGKLVIVDPRKGTEEEAGIEYICSSAPDGTRGRKAASEIPLKHDKGQHLDGFGQEGPQFAHPFPLGEDNILVSFTADGYQGFGVWGAKSKNPNRKGENFGLFWMDADGRRELLAYDPRRNSLEATPVVAREKPFLRGTRVDETQSFGTFYVKDVYHGPGAEGIARGTIKKLRVVALEYRAAWAGSLWAKGPGGDSCAQTPIGLQNCSWDVKHILGEADVAADGSCTFACPAHQAVYFQLIDDKGRCAQTMRSWTHLMGGESASCTGCHESKNESYQGAPAVQAEAKPQRLKPFAGVEHPLLARYEKEGRLASVENYLGVNTVRSFDPQAPIEGFSFERRVQPILDRHCVRCHSPEAKAGGGVKPSKFDLTARKVRRVGDRRKSGSSPQRAFNQSYISLTGNGTPTPTVNWCLQESAPPLQKPYACGSATSSLVKRIEGGHGGAKLSRDEHDTICAWIDLAVPYCGSYLEGRAWDAEDEEAYARFQRKRMAYAAQELADLRKALTR